MIVRTKRFALPKKTYVLLACRNLIRTQWWVFLAYAAVNALAFFLPSWWWFWGSTGVLLLYWLFWFLQFYGLGHLEQFKIYFQPMRYEISSKEVIMRISTKHGMPISWSMIKSASLRKGCFVLHLNKAQLIYLPFKVFNSPHEIKFVETILRRKRYL